MLLAYRWKNADDAVQATTAIGVSVVSMAVFGAAEALVATTIDDAGAAAIEPGSAMATAAATAGDTNS